MQVEVTRIPELELPIEVSVAYIMFEDFQQGAQYSRRLTGESVIKTDIALPVVMSAPRAVMVARSSLYSAIAGRNVYKFSTTCTNRIIFSCVRIYNSFFSELAN